MYISQLMFHSSHILFTRHVVQDRQDVFFLLSQTCACEKVHFFCFVFFSFYTGTQTQMSTSDMLLCQDQADRFFLQTHLSLQVTFASLSQWDIEVSYCGKPLSGWNCLEDKVLSWCAVFAFPQEEYCIYDLDYIPALSQKSQRSLWLSYSPGHSHAAASHWNALFTHRTLFSKVDTFWHSDILILHHQTLLWKLFWRGLIWSVF